MSFLSIKWFGSYLYLKIEFLSCSCVASLITIDISFYKTGLLLSQCNVYFGRSSFQINLSLN